MIKVLRGPEFNTEVCMKYTCFIFPQREKYSAMNNLQGPATSNTATFLNIEQNRLSVTHPTFANNVILSNLTSKCYLSEKNLKIQLGTEHHYSIYYY